MATQVNTIENILKKLNGVDASGKTKEGPWTESREPFALMSVEVKEKDKFEFNSGRGIVVRVFINWETGEIRNYLAKVLNVSEGKLLP